jgi:hypothetical protein
MMKALSIFLFSIAIASQVVKCAIKPEQSLEESARAALSGQLGAFHRTGDGSVDLYLAAANPLDNEVIISAVCGRYGDEFFIFTDMTQELYFRPKQATDEDKSKAEMGLAFFWHTVCKHGDPVVVSKLMDRVNSADKLWLSSIGGAIEEIIAADAEARAKEEE